ncbi:MAG: hypothetical protein ACT4PV_12965 [Planctomycetaceae bacterium]
MQLLPALLILLAPEWRVPVLAEPLVDSDDPVLRRLASLMVGQATRAGRVTLVPLYARVPSEARLGPAEPIWGASPQPGLVVAEGSALYLRVRNPSDAPRLIPAGCRFGTDERPLWIDHDLLLPPRFACLVPFTGFAVPTDGGCLPGTLAAPSIAGRLLRENASLELLGQRVGSVEALAALASAARVEQSAKRLRAAAAPLLDAFGGTATGIVLLLGDDVVAVHLLASHDLLLAALPDLLRSAAQEEELALLLGLPPAPPRFSNPGREDPAIRGVLPCLRRLLEMRGDWQESFGAGFEVSYASSQTGYAGAGVVSAEQRLVHAAFYRAPREARQGGGGAPLPPQGPGGEEAPGAVARKARPTLEEERQRERRPDSGHAGAPRAPGG